MKKMTLGLLAASVLTVGMLAGCNNNESAPKAKWTDEQAETFSSHLYGVIPPAVDKIDNIVVEYNDTSDYVYAFGSGCTAKILESYSKKFKAKNGWEAYDLNSKNAYAFMNEVSTDDGVRHVYTVFYAVNRDGEYVKSGKGSFYMELYDPFYYEWQDEIVAYFADDYDSENVPPSIAADYYLFDTDNYEIVCYYDYEGTGDDGGYAQILANNHWTTRAELDADDYYIANCPDGKYSIRYKYFAQYGYLDIWFDVAIFDSIPTGMIGASFTKYAKYGAVAFEFPAPEGASLTFSYAEDPWNALYEAFDSLYSINGILMVYGLTAQEYADYLTALDTTYGWDLIDGEYCDYEVSKTQGDYINRFDLTYEQGALSIVFYLVSEHIPYTNWPSELVAKLFPSFITDVIPAYTGENAGFKMQSNGVLVLLDEESETDPNELVSAYITVLTTALFVLNEDSGNYTSPNSQFEVGVSLTGSGISITYTLLPIVNDSCASIISAWLEMVGLSATALPSVSLTGASWYISSYSNSRLYIRAEGNFTAEQLLAAVNSFAGGLDSSYYVSYVYSENDKKYTSDTYGISVNPYYTSGGYFIISVSVD